MELYGIYHGLNLNWGKSIYQLIVEFDSLHAIKLIKLEMHEEHPLFPLGSIKLLLQCCWKVFVSHILREANTAYYCIGLGQNLSLEFHKILDPSPEFENILQDDLAGKCWYKKCRIQFCLIFSLPKKEKRKKRGYPTQKKKYLIV